MKEYTASDLLRVAKRQNNKKRSYLLIDPLQAKHLAVSPSKALAMMDCLGKKLAEKYPSARLLIGFAETATAIGAAAAERMGNGCIYLTTTREPYTAGRWIEFLEEHSHAAEQRLSETHLSEWIHSTDTVILLDDELSTGKTLRNMVRQLREHFPELSQKKIIAASILNRLTEEQERLMKEEGIASEYLLKLPETDFSRELAVETKEAADPPLPEPDTVPPCISLPGVLPNPRFGAEIGTYCSHCRRLSRDILKRWADLLTASERILVLGTEECMFPALVLGREIEEHFSKAQVFCHATTRSPIGISSSPGYPIWEGFRLPGLYDANRATYLYNLNRYDLVLVLTDAAAPSPISLRALYGALRRQGCKNILFLTQKTAEGI